MPSSAREPRGREGARSRGSGKGNGGRSIRAPQRRRHQTRRRTRRCRRRRCGRRCPRRLPRPAGAGSGEAISVRQIRGRGVYGARARCVARGRGEGTRGRYARVPSRLFLTSRTSRSPRLAVRVRAMVRPRRGTRNGSLSTTRADRSKHSDHPAESARAVGRNADSATGGGSPSQRGYCRPRDVYAGDVDGTRVDSTRMSGAETSGASRGFTYLLIPADPECSILELEGERLRYAGDALPEALRSRFANRAGAGSTASLDDKTARILAASDGGKTETFALVHPAATNGNRGVYMYTDEVGKLRGLPENSRAGDLADRCGLARDGAFHGDAFVGAVITHPEVTNASFTADELHPDAPWLVAAPAENAAYAHTMREFMSAVRAKSVSTRTARASSPTEPPPEATFATTPRRTNPQTTVSNPAKASNRTSRASSRTRTTPPWSETSPRRRVRALRDAPAKAVRRLMDGGAAGVHANPGKRRRGSRVRVLSQVHRRPRRAAQPRRGRVFGGGSRRERRDARERKRVRNARGLVDGGARARGDVRGASRGGGHRAGGAVSPPRHARVLGVVLFDDVSRAPRGKRPRREVRREKSIRGTGGAAVRGGGRGDGGGGRRQRVSTTLRPPRRSRALRRGGGKPRRENREGRGLGDGDDAASSILFRAVVGGVRGERRGRRERRDASRGGGARAVGLLRASAARRSAPRRRNRRDGRRRIPTPTPTSTLETPRRRLARRWRRSRGFSIVSVWTAPGESSGRSISTSGPSRLIIPCATCVAKLLWIDVDEGGGRRGGDVGGVTSDRHPRAGETRRRR